MSGGGARLLTALRRRRGPLCLLIGYMFALNLLVATVLESRDAAMSPLLSAVQAANCTPDGRADATADEVADRSGGVPGGMPACPSCDKLCPLGACAPAGQPTALLAAAGPESAAGLEACEAEYPVRRGGARHDSDVSAQAPPDGQGSHPWNVAEKAL